MRFSPIIKKIILDIAKCDLAWKYVNDPSKVPKGRKVEQTRSGKWKYETIPRAKKSASNPTKKSTKSEPVDSLSHAREIHARITELSATMDQNIVDTYHMNLSKYKEFDKRISEAGKQLEGLKKIKGNVKDRNKVRKLIENIIREQDHLQCHDLRDAYNKYRDEMMNKVAKPIADMMDAAAGISPDAKKFTDTIEFPQSMDIGGNLIDFGFFRSRLQENTEHSRSWYDMMTKGISSTGSFPAIPISSGRSACGVLKGTDKRAAMINCGWLTPTHRIETSYVHEVSHMLEENGNFIQKTLDFLNKRTENSPEMKMSDLKPDGGYRPEEIVKPDNFPDPYCGKIYSDKNATEILSMGMQYLYEDPKKFADKDPEYFQFIINILIEAKKNAN